MADDFVTVVTYDVSAAINELDKLDDALRKTSNDAERSFDRMERSSKDFERVINDLGGGRITNLADNFRSFSSTFGVIGLTAGAVGVALAGVAGELVNIPELTKDAAAATEELNRQLEQQLDLRNAIDNVGDARLFRGFEEDRRALDERRNDQASEANRLDEQKEVLTERLRQYEDFYDKIDDRAKKSARERESLEDKLERVVADREISQLGGLPIGRQITELVSRSRQAGDAGDLDRAERLLEEAKRASSRSGDTSGFFNRQIASAEDALIANIQKQVGARKQAEAAINAQKLAVEKLIAAQKQEIAGVTSLQKENRRERRVIQIDSRQLEQQRRVADDENKAADATRERAAAVQQLNNLLSSERSLLQQVGDLGRITAGTFTGIGPSRLTEQIEALSRAQDLIRRGAGRLDERTTDGDRAAGKDFDKAQDILNKLNELRAGGGLSSALNFNLDNLNAAQAQMEKILSAGEKLEGAGRRSFRKEDDDGFLKGSESASDSLKRAREDSEGIANALSRAADASLRINPQVPGVAAGVPLPQQAAAPVASQVASNTTEINVNATVKGGIIDAETTRLITDIIRKEIRKGTGAAIA